MYFNPLVHKTPVGAVAAGESFKLRFPCPATLDIERVTVFFCPHGASHSQGFYRELEKKPETRGLSMFEGSFIIPEAGIWQYRFETHSKAGITFYGRGADGTAATGDCLPMWQLTVTKAGYKTPDWVKGGIIYHIFVDRFKRGREIPFTKRRGSFHKDWFELPETAESNRDYRADDFFGGNLSGITEKLGYIKSLGTTLVYLSPVFSSMSNHRYDTGDYLKLDELIGTEEELETLVSEAAKLGIKIIFDGVFNHTGADSIYFNKWGNYDGVGAYQSEDSPYKDWFFFEKFPNKYHCWWGVTVVPTVNKSSEGYRKLIFGEGGVIEKWMKKGVAGWRLDVVDELPSDFVDLIRKKVKEINPDGYILGEVWEDASTKVSYGTMRPYLLGGQLDGVMNYPFKHAILTYLMTSDAQAFKNEVTPIIENYPKEALDASMTLIGSHDTVRALTYLSGQGGGGMTKAQKAAYALSGRAKELAVARLKLAAVLEYTLPGVPSVYYGDEAGVEGFEDPTNRKTYPWGRENRDILDFYKKLGYIRTRHRELLLGDTVFDRRADMLIFYRKSGRKRLTVAVNSTSSAKVLHTRGGTDLFTGSFMEGAAEIPPLGFLILLE
ncbi:MAG: glycoside hydrolase family 13 protein [Christensenellales bacterium]|jgi:glycosidase